MYLVHNLDQKHFTFESQNSEQPSLNNDHVNVWHRDEQFPFESVGEGWRIHKEASKINKKPKEVFQKVMEDQE